MTRKVLPSISFLSHSPFPPPASASLRPPPPYLSIASSASLPLASLLLCPSPPSSVGSSRRCAQTPAVCSSSGTRKGRPRGGAAARTEGGHGELRRHADGGGARGGRSRGGVAAGWSNRWRGRRRAPWMGSVGPKGLSRVFAFFYLPRRTHIRL